MKRKCLICGEKHEYDPTKIFTKPQKLVYIYMGMSNFSKSSKLICRTCISRVLDSLQREQHKIIDRLDTKEPNFKARR